MKQCPRCASEISVGDKVCPRCNLPVDKMNLDFSDENKPKKVKLTSAQKRERKKQEKLARKEEQRAKKLREQRSDTDFSKFASNSNEPVGTDIIEARKAKKKKSLAPKFELDEHGEFNIDTADVEIIGEKTGKMIEEHHKQTYSVKKARGDYREPKIKWWEIYKLADRSFARRKIKKEVSKAAKIKPDFISKTKLFLLTLFFGWCGAHNFYAKNKRKGWVSVVCLILWISIHILGLRRIWIFDDIQLSVSGLCGFIVMFIWLSDIVNVLFNNFKYRIQSDEFIFGMNVKTRAKLGEKYIDLDLYQKPWWVRFKVWCQKKKRGYDEWQHDRRQRMIEKEKAKQARLEEIARIDAEIAEFEAKESLKSKDQKMEDVKKSLKETKVLDDIKTFENENDDSDNKPSSNKGKKNTPSKKAKISVKTKNKNNKK